MWDILNIEPTKDKKLIKKAYARQLKNTSPEDDPEGFQRLHEAYENAQRYVKNDSFSFSFTAEKTEDIILSPLENQLVQDQQAKEYEQILNEIHLLDARSSYNDWQSILQIRKNLSLQDQTRFERDLVLQLCELGMVDYRCLIARISEDIVDLLDNEFQWRSHDLQLRDWIGLGNAYTAFHSALHQYEKPTFEELLVKIEEALNTPEKSSSHAHWARLVKKAELFSRKQRLSMGTDVFNLLIKSALKAHVQPRSEGLNALDRLFEFTRSKNRLKLKYERKLTPETAFLKDLLPTLRRTTTSPLTELGYEKILLGKTWLALKTIGKFVFYLAIIAIFILLCFSVPGFGGLVFLYFVISRIIKGIKSLRKINN